MKNIIATLQVLLMLTFCGCATHYNEPDPTKVIESTKKVKQDINQAHENSKKVTKNIQTAQEAADTLAVVSNTLMGRIDELLGIVPDQYKPPITLIKADVTNLQIQENVLVMTLGGAYKTQTLQEKLLADTDLHELELEKNQLEYRNDAQQLADTTTKLSAKVAWYRLHWWGSWIAFGAGIIICIIFAILKVVGKLPI